MYKLLATSALVAAGLWGTTEAAFAQAKVAPISVVVGGYMEQTFGYADNDSNVNYSSNIGTGPTNNPNSMSQQSDSEIWFGGRTVLANGMTIGFDIQLEGNTAGDQIDESFIFLDGAFGRALLGSENTADYLMNYSIPGIGKAYGALESGAVNWIVRPTNVTILDTVQSGKGSGGGGNMLPNGGNDQQRVTYFTPRFFGFQGGITYTPNVGGSSGFISGGSFEDTNGFVNQNVNRSNAWSGGLNFVNNFSGFQIGASLGISYYPSLSSSATPNNDSITDISVGGQVGFAGFTFGGGYRNLDGGNGAEDGYAWGLGLSFTTGPFSVGANYLTSVVNGSSTNSGEDKFYQYLASAAYTMGPGVDLIGSLFYLKYEDEGGLSVNENAGVGAIVGLRLTF